ncbi:hypothetical protein ACDT12_13780, partial [Staphylococcus aureus]
QTGRGLANLSVRSTLCSLGSTGHLAAKWPTWSHFLHLFSVSLGFLSSWQSLAKCPSDLQLKQVKGLDGFSRGARSFGSLDFDGQSRAR